MKVTIKTADNGFIVCSEPGPQRSHNEIGSSTYVALSVERALQYVRDMLTERKG